MWPCPKCGNDVEDSFDVCWSCGTSREGVEDPDFVTADDAEPIVDADDPAKFLGDDPLADFAGTPVPLPELVACYRAGNTIEASFLADRLNEVGIPAIADHHDMTQNLGGYHPQMWGSGPRILVRAKDLAAARAWLEDYRRRRLLRHDEAE